MNLFSPIVFEGTALGVLLAIVLLIFFAMSFVFAYHWKRFGTPTPLFGRMKRLYFAVSVMLATLSILLYVIILASF